MRFTWHMLLRSLLLRRARSITALTAILVAATIATVLLNLYSDAHAKFASEFRGFGANVAISGVNINTAALALQPGEIAVPFSYVFATTAAEEPVVGVGTDLDALLRLNTFWNVRRVNEPGNAVFGAKTFALKGNKSISVNNTTLDLTPSSVVTTGDADESRIFISLERLRQLQPNTRTQVVMLAVPGDPERVKTRIAQLRAADPQYTIEPVRNIVDTQVSVLTKMHAVMWLSTLLIATIAALSLWASLSAGVLERRRDFAVLKALGASQLNVTYTFLLEQIAIGLVGALLGYVLGCILAALIGYINFHSIVGPRIEVLPWIIVGATLIVIVGALIPLQRLQKITPAAILKGE